MPEDHRAERAIEPDPYPVTKRQPGHARPQPFGLLGATQANAPFSTSDFRFTVGEDGFLYVFCMTVPAPGTVLTINSLGTNQAALTGPIKTVSLLGSTAPIVWTQTATQLSITCPTAMPFRTAVAFKIGPTMVARPAAR